MLSDPRLQNDHKSLFRRDVILDRFLNPNHDPRVQIYDHEKNERTDPSRMRVQTGKSGCLLLFYVLFLLSGDRMQQTFSSDRGWRFCFP